MQVLKVRMHIEVTLFRNCAEQFRNRRTVSNTVRNFEIFKLRNAISNLLKFTNRAEHGDYDCNVSLNSSTFFPEC